MKPKTVTLPDGRMVEVRMYGQIHGEGGYTLEELESLIRSRFDGRYNESVMLELIEDIGNLRAENERLREALEIADLLGFAALNHVNKGGVKSIRILQTEVEKWQQNWMVRYLSEQPTPNLPKREALND